jgi:hypothetical protein
MRGSWSRHEGVRQRLAHCLDDRWDIVVGFAQKVPGRASPPCRSEQRTPSRQCEGENGRSLTTSDTKTRPLNQVSVCQIEFQLIHEWWKRDGLTVERQLGTL